VPATPAFVLVMLVVADRVFIVGASIRAGANAKRRHMTVGVDRRRVWRRSARATTRNDDNAAGGVNIHFESG
jgi:hypothetical protein